MSLRIRKNGRIFCAAHSLPEDGDFYLDDYVHGYIGGDTKEKKQEPKPLHWYDWSTHEYFIDGGKERSGNAIRMDCWDCMKIHTKPCKKHEIGEKNNK